MRSIVAASLKFRFLVVALASAMLFVGVGQLGHAGTGDLEILIQNAADLERAQPLLLRSYQGA